MGIPDPGGGRDEGDAVSIRAMATTAFSERVSSEDQLIRDPAGGA